eukprot:3938652-Rhodomonas_salina.1
MDTVRVVKRFQTIANDEGQFKMTNEELAYMMETTKDPRIVIVVGPEEDDTLSGQNYICGPWRVVKNPYLSPKTDLRIRALQCPVEGCTYHLRHLLVNWRTNLIQVEYQQASAKKILVHFHYNEETPSQ